MKLQIGMQVRIKNNKIGYGNDAGTIKTITSHLPDYCGKKSYELDYRQDSIWQVEDFSEFISYPDLPME